ncbi:hypothetical protein [Streptomyces sp. 135]|uniref:hypothetical protein n=1 Tax=Streptomyces sp. 135 TaxID=2838850 RepID=UPI001CBF5176|nr:hypothetical protein [Streptomyces sp. 135]
MAAFPPRPGTVLHRHLAVHCFRIVDAGGDASAARRLKGLLRPTGRPGDHALDPHLD